MNDNQEAAMDAAQDGDVGTEQETGGLTDEEREVIGRWRFAVRHHRLHMQVHGLRQRTIEDVGVLLDIIDRLAASRPAPAARWADVDPEEVARAFHETYERLAPSYGYETRKESAVPWADVPQQNRDLMTDTCREIMVRFARPAPAAGAEAEDRARVDALLDEYERRGLTTYKWRCANGHVSRMYLKSEALGGVVCLACREFVRLTHPDDEETPPSEQAPAVAGAQPVHEREAPTEPDGYVVDSRILGEWEPVSIGSRRILTQDEADREVRSLAHRRVRPVFFGPPWIRQSCGDCDPCIGGAPHQCAVGSYFAEPPVWLVTQEDAPAVAGAADELHPDPPAVSEARLPGRVQPEAVALPEWEEGLTFDERFALEEYRRSGNITRTLAALGSSYTPEHAAYAQKRERIISALRNIAVDNGSEIPTKRVARQAVAIIDDLLIQIYNASRLTPERAAPALTAEHAEAAYMAALSSPDEDTVQLLREIAAHIKAGPSPESALVRALEQIAADAPDEEPEYDDWGGDTEAAESWGLAQAAWKAGQVARKALHTMPERSR